MPSVGFFIRLPKELAKQYPTNVDMLGDLSAKHITVLFAGELTEDEIKKFKKVARTVISHFTYRECFVGGLAFFKAPGHQIAHSMVECKGLYKIHRALWDAGLDLQIKIGHGYSDYVPHVTIDCPEERKHDYNQPSGSFMVKEIEMWAGLGRKVATFKLSQRSI